MTTDTSEKGLETLIMRHMTGTDGLAVAPGTVADEARRYAALAISPAARRTTTAPTRSMCRSSLPSCAPPSPRRSRSWRWRRDDPKDINRLKFLARLSAEIGKRGVIDVLRKGVEHGPVHFDLFYGTPSPGNAKAEALHAQNRFSITRQLAYSMDETRRALDLCLFINGLPIATFELKNSLTKQTVEDAVEQYRRDRDPRERLFEFGRCVVHFAVDDSEVQMCTELKGKALVVPALQQGLQRRRGQPAQPARPQDRLSLERGAHPGGADQHPRKLRADRRGEGPAHRQEEAQAGWPRYHQLGVVRQALADVRAHGAGKRYLIQHSAGSGKSNSIAWLAHQLIGLKRDDKEVFDSVIVVTDRRLLDDQIQTTIKQFMQVGATVGHAERSGDLRKFIEEGKKIIVSTVQKFPFILDEIATEGGKTFAIVIDEAHSSQGGKTSAAMSQALSARRRTKTRGPTPRTR